MDRYMDGGRSAKDTQGRPQYLYLKEDFDTTTSQGKRFVTIMGVLNEFEREQTNERTPDWSS
ncbi:MAG: hypothetical protein HYZ81_17145 [Nitrospinae bacterium]|nr:hypothetical protein [Nitrospinota bacterium]